MPCNSDYMNPTERERLLQETAKLLVHVYKKQKKKIPGELQDAANDMYCKEDFVPTLCRTIKDMSATEMELIVYNSHDATSRRLADWWEEHMAADKKRISKEESSRKQLALAKKAMSKLTEAELEALENYFLGNE